MEEDILKDAVLLVNDSWGIYVPQRFIQNYEHTPAGHANSWRVSEENACILKAGPDHEHYWEAWDEVLQSATFYNRREEKFSLYQDGDLWAVPAE